MARMGDLLAGASMVMACYTAGGTGAGGTEGQVRPTQSPLGLDVAGPVSAKYLIEKNQP
jgi:hypothetical protein